MKAPVSSHYLHADKKPLLFRPLKQLLQAILADSFHTDGMTTEVPVNSLLHETISHPSHCAKWKFIASLHPNMPLLGIYLFVDAFKTSEWSVESSFVGISFSDPFGGPAFSPYG